MSKLPSDNDVLFQNRSEEVFPRKQKKTNQAGYPNRGSNNNYINVNQNIKNSAILEEEDEFLKSAKLNGAKLENADKSLNIRQQILSKKQSSQLFEKNQIEDENARGFDCVFNQNTSKSVSSKHKDYENSMSSKGDSKFTAKSEQSSQLFTSNPNQINSSSIHDTSNINSKILQQSSHHHQLSNNNHSEFQNISTKVANLNSLKDKSQANKTQISSQQQLSKNQNSIIHQLNQNSHNFPYYQQNNPNLYQQSQGLFDVDSINQLIKQDQTYKNSINNNNNIIQINGSQIQSQEQIQQLQLQSIQSKQSQQMLFNTNSQNHNSNFHNDFIHSQFGQNSQYDLNISQPFKENIYSNGLTRNLLPQNDSDVFDNEGGIVDYFCNDKQENDNKGALLGKNMLSSFAQITQQNHKNLISSPSGQANNFQFPNQGLKKSQVKQESLLSSNQNDQNNLIDQARSQVDDYSNNGEQTEERQALRGLRALSLKVKEIVQEKGSTTYKEVAETLVQNLKAGQRQLAEKEDIKDEQNIKRRVYDALNVLIASEVIAKKGKKVLAIPKTNLAGKCLRHDNWKEAKEKQDVLDKQKQKVNQKKDQIKELARKYVALKNLINRNQSNEKNTQMNSQMFENFINHKDDYDDNQKFFINSQLSNKTQTQGQGLRDKILLPLLDISKQKFQFPVLSVRFNPDGQQRVIMKMSKEKNNLKIFAKGYLETYGDLDILCQLSLDKVQDQFRQQVLGDKYLNWINSVDQIKTEHIIEEENENQYQQHYMMDDQNNY
ncbi:hypothetical protein ABPG72_012714 [Tetrahymena utriculariae]